MPEISHFLGVIIYMYFNDHNPPHFHVHYNEFRAMIDIEKLTLITGELPPRVLGFVIEWAKLHHLELKKNWQTMASTGHYTKIEPLV